MFLIVLIRNNYFTNVDLQWVYDVIRSRCCRKWYLFMVYCFL